MTSRDFFSAFSHLDSYQEQGVPFTAWLYRIAHNLVVDYFRRESKRESVPIDDQPPAASTRGNPVETVMADIESERLYGAMRKLTHNQREVIVLKFIDNLSNGQVAEIMGISVGAVKSTQKRGLLSLNRILGNSRGHSVPEAE